MHMALDKWAWTAFCIGCLLWLSKIGLRTSACFICENIHDTLSVSALILYGSRVFFFSNTVLEFWKQGFIKS